MKAAVLYTVLASLSVSGLNAYAQGTCTNGSGNHAAPEAPFPSTFPATLPSAADVSNFLNSGKAPAVTPNSGASATPAAPAARITVVDPAAPSSSSTGSTASATPSARLTVVDDLATTPANPQVAEVTPTIDENETLDAALAGLVGTWKAVARHGDGELTTVELQLDNRGWAELTVPAADGTKSTIKRRVELENQELKLTSPDAELLLGKLVSVNTRQMVLERAGGQVTFVRPVN